MRFPAVQSSRLVGNQRGHVGPSLSVLATVARPGTALSGYPSRNGNSFGLEQGVPNANGTGAI
jgi:hypothetical protein